MWKFKSGQVWNTSSGQFTGDQLLRFFNAIPDVNAMCAVMETSRLTDRRCDRALQLLRKAGLIHFNRITRAWSKVNQ